MTDSDCSASLRFLIITSSLAVTRFVATYIPALILISSYLVALVRAKDIHLKIKTLLINLILPDLVLVIKAVFDLFFHPIRAFVGNERFLVTCYLNSYTAFVSQNGNSLMAALYAVAIFWTVKFNIKSLKWKAIIICLTAIWVFSTAQATILFFSDFRRSENGYCLLDLTPLYVAVVVSSTAVLAVCTLITVIFSIVSYRYVKRNTLTDESGSSAVQRSLVKLLVFEAFKIFTNLLRSIIIVVITINNNLTSFSDNYTENVGLLIVRNVIGFLLNAFVVILTVIMSVVFLKAVREAFKQMLPKCLQPALNCCTTEAGRAN